MKLLSIIILSSSLLLGCNYSSVTPTEKAKAQAYNQQLPTQKQDSTFSFDHYNLNETPQDWSAYFTGRGDTTIWNIIDDNGNRVLAQLSSDQANYHFNEIVYNGFKAKNVSLEVKMKGVNGKKDQGGGFVWRFIDRDNYYVVRANPLEDNVVLYKVVDGDRTDLPVLGKGRTYGVDVKQLGKDWNTLKLTVIDDLFTVFLNGQQIFQVKDKTFTEAGRVGLWTKADAVSYFDNFKIQKIK